MFRDFRIETERLILRAFTLDDLIPFHAILSREEVMRYLPENVRSLEEVEHILDFVTDCYSRNTPDNIVKFTVAVIDKATGHLIGWAGLGPLEFAPGRIELYYGLAEARWGKGLAPEAARGVLDFGFRSLCLPEIVAVVNPENNASVRVLEKLGIRCREVVRGLQADQAFYEGFLLYSLTRQEYEGPAGADHTCSDEPCRNGDQM